MIRTGHWIPLTDQGKVITPDMKEQKDWYARLWKCSRCGNVVSEDQYYHSVADGFAYRYCPYCGSCNNEDEKVKRGVYKR